MRPQLVDLCCSAGGAAKGYHDAGFDVLGVDLADQPNYPYEFVKADAVTFPLEGFDAIHASPPCQGYSYMSNCRPGLAGQYAQLIDVIRPRLESSGLPWVLENVEGSGLAEQDDLMGSHGLLLCGSMFGLPLYRHRLFETSSPVRPPHHPRHLIPASKAGHWKPGTIISVAGHCSPIDVAREAMGGIDWMTREELAESIPPAFAEYLGRALLAELGRRAA
jgi:DNA (cytosine-5)-methyltransferase 1